MNWDMKLNSILNDTDSNVAKIKQRLNTAGYCTKDDMLAKIDTRNIHFSDAIPVFVEPLNSYSDTLNPTITREELTDIYRKLQSQGRAIQSLHQNLMRVEAEKEYQQQKIRSLEEEIRRIHSRPDDRSLDFQLERKMEEWRREVSNEIYSLREQVQRQRDGGFSHGSTTITNVMQEVRESKRELYEEFESLRREIDNLKHKQRRQEEDLQNQISETKDLKRSLERDNKTLGELMNKYQSHCLNFNRSIHEREYTEQELTHVKSAVAGLKKQLTDLHLGDHLTSTPSKPGGTNTKEKRYRKKKHKAQSLNEDSDSDFSYTLSLVDISSDDDFTCSQDLDSFKQNKKGARRTTSGISTSTLEDSERQSNDSDVSVNLGLSDSPPELNLSDLS
ncbi:centrosomal protein of 112 kDa isoform X2 [Callorhinchus milii]|nr:centrosomal protein of 112 kDa isoform X2 [Callorhinchus milii]XP_042191280.1 centrosomal protein of 112 kDa isoform X2 [Callorhinchus milii]